jgi:hypothetical protein
LSVDVVFIFARRAQIHVGHPTSGSGLFRFRLVRRRFVRPRRAHVDRAAEARSLGHDDLRRLDVAVDRGAGDELDTRRSFVTLMRPLIVPSTTTGSEPLTVPSMTTFGPRYVPAKDGCGSPGRGAGRAGGASLEEKRAIGGGA